MDCIRFQDLQGDYYKSGRHTRVLIGVNSPVQAGHFVSGIVTVEPGGMVPSHNHPQEEVYYILDGLGEMVVEKETKVVEGITAIYIPPGAEHSLRNTGEVDLTMLFIYSPAGIVAHWEEERAGRL